MSETSEEHVSAEQVPSSVVEISETIRSHLCRVVTDGGFIYRDREATHDWTRVCMKPLPCEDHPRSLDRLSAEDTGG